jgi:separase
MTNAQSIALNDRQFMDLAKSTTTLSGRLRFNKIVAAASYVQSLLATAVGSYKAAARHARQCVTLNRRIWAALESRTNVKKTTSAEKTETMAPLVMSVTHEALSGPEFWSLVPALYRALMQQSQIFAHQGLLHEAIHVAEQAEKVAAATESATLITDNGSWRADCWAQSGRPDKAETILNTLSPDPSRKCLSTAGYHSAVARMHNWNGQYEQEILSYDSMEKLLQELSAPSYVKSLETFSPSVDALVDQVSSMTLETKKDVKVKPATRGRKPTVKAAPRAASRSTVNARSKATEAAAKTVSRTKRQTVKSLVSEAPSIADQCSALCLFQASMRDRAVLANLLHNDLDKALEILGEAEQLQTGPNQEVSHMWAIFKAKLAQSAKQIAEDFTVNTLPESTIAFPAFGLKERRLSDATVAKKGALGSSTTAKGGRAKKQTKVDFMDTLRDARARLVEAHNLCASNGSNHLFRQTSMALGHVTVLMSAVSGTELPSSLHPLYAAYMSGT